MAKPPRPAYDRNAEARALGFRNYYEIRIRGGITAARAGRITPDTPRPTGEELRQARGHAGLFDLVREFPVGGYVQVGVNLGQLNRNDAGNWDEIPVKVFGDTGERDYVLRDLSDDELVWLLGQLADLDADYSPDYDLNSLVPAGF
jgi:hypothetical protein